MEDRNGILELLTAAFLVVIFTATYAFIALILYTLDIDDKLAAKGFSKLQYGMIIFVITVLSIILLGLILDLTVNSHIP
jgi:hypothetical protein